MLVQSLSFRRNEVVKGVENSPITELEKIANIVISDLILVVQKLERYRVNR